MPGKKKKYETFDDLFDAADELITPSPPTKKIGPEASSGYDTEVQNFVDTDPDFLFLKEQVVT